MRQVVTLSILALLFDGCTSSSRGDAGADALVFDYHRPPTQPGDILLETPEFEVPASSEVTMCTYTDVRTPMDVITRELHSYQGPGGHHVVFFYTTMPQEPGIHPCLESEMSYWRFVGGGQESQESALALPPGVGIRVPAGMQLVIQSHYLNVMDRPVRTRDALVVRPADPSTIQNVVDSYNIYDDSLEIPPHAAYGRTLECAIDQDMHVVSVLGHTHGYGTRVRVAIVPADGGTERVIYSEAGGDRLQFSPPIYTFANDGGIAVRAGERIRLYCDWMNTSNMVLTPPQEMCASLLYYYPARGAVVCGNVIETRGGGNRDAGVVDGGGNGGCASPPAPGESCVRPCNTGNERGVGRYCTPSGTECQNNNGAFLCTAAVDPSGPWFCTKPCSSDSVCGSGAACIGDSRGRGCVPVECIDAPADAGADASMVDAAVMDAASD